MFFGITRFSFFYPNTNWRIARDGYFATPAEYAEYLFSPDRLDPRFDIFENLSLPNLERLAASDEFVHVLNITNNMPDAYRERVHGWARRYPFLVVNEKRLGEDDGFKSIEQICHETMAARCGASSAVTPFARFRLDDDDILSSDFIDQMRPYVAPAFVGMSVSLPMTYAGFYNGPGEGVENLRIWKTPMHSAGLAYVCAYDGSKDDVEWVNIGSHHKQDEFSPTIHDSRRPSAFKLWHVEQDTSFENPGQERDPAEIKSKLMGKLDRFPALSDVSGVARLFPEVSKRLVG